jgi:hypothetical protein
MDKRNIHALLLALANVVPGDGPWQEKRDAVLAEADESDKINLEEFASWFEGGVMRVRVDLVEYVNTQLEWSEKMFGEGNRRVGTIEHIRRELTEISEATTRQDALREWVDVVILALEGAWREGFTAEQVVTAIVEKQLVNRRRTWPTEQSPDLPIEHMR